VNVPGMAGVIEMRAMIVMLARYPSVVPSIFAVGEFSRTLSLVVIYHCGGLS
jgi:hypothetical protein